MKKQLGIICLTLLMTVTYQTVALANDVLDKIKQTGVITAGVRKDTIPFGYVNQEGKWVGYSLDILELIRKQAEEELNKPIKLNLVEVTPENRFAKIQDQSIDIECASSTFTWERERIVDFSVSYFASGTQLIVKKGSGIDDPSTLANKKIGVIPKTTNEQVIKNLQPDTQLIYIKDLNDGFAKFQAGEMEGLAGDGIVLEGLRLKTVNPDAYEVVPKYPYMVESYGCMLPQNQSAWRDLVNYALIKYMEGVVGDEYTSAEIFDRWFGSEGVAPYSREFINEYFLGIINGLEWIPLSTGY